MSEHDCHVVVAHLVSLNLCDNERIAKSFAAFDALLFVTAFSALLSDSDVERSIITAFPQMSFSTKRTERINHTGTNAPVAAHRRHSESCLHKNLADLREVNLIVSFHNL